MACCSFSIDLSASSSSCCCTIVEISPSLMIIYSFSSRLFSTVSFEKFSSSCCNNAARIASLSVAGQNPLLIDGLDIGLCHWPCRWVDGAQYKYKCWFFLRISCEIFGWLTILGFPVNLSDDWLLSNLKRWKSSTAQFVVEGKSVSWGGALTKGGVRECELTKNIFFHSDLLQLCLKKNGR